MPSDASAEAIRAAYRRLAREHHPDVGGASEAIHAVNEAYRVLGDPGRRVLYDRSLGEPATPIGRATHDVDDQPEPSPVLPPARFPWRGLLVATVVAVVAVGAASVLTDPSPPPGPDGILAPGSCVSIEPNTDARETTCTGDPAVDIVVRQVVPVGVACPFGTNAHRDHQGLGTACLDFPTHTGG